MGGVVQQVNLYRGYESAKTTNQGARLLLFAGLGALLTVVVLAGLGEVYVTRLDGQRAAVAAELKEREGKVAALKARLVSPSIDPFLEAELARLNEAKARLDANLTAIARHAGEAPDGFSEYFSGLARNTLQGLWFDKVGVSSGGAVMLLGGQTTEPALVPRLLRNLADEPAFSGRTFRKVTFERRGDEPEGAFVDFELRTAQPEEVDDAG